MWEGEINMMKKTFIYSFIHFKSRSVLEGLSKNVNFVITQFISSHTNDDLKYVSSSSSLVDRREGDEMRERAVSAMMTGVAEMKTNPLICRI